MSRTYSLLQWPITLQDDYDMFNIDKLEIRAV